MFNPFIAHRAKRKSFLQFYLSVCCFLMLTPFLQHSYAQTIIIIDDITRLSSTSLGEFSAESLPHLQRYPNPAKERSKNNELIKRKMQVLFPGFAQFSQSAMLAPQ